MTGIRYLDGLCRSGWAVEMAGGLDFGRILEMNEIDLGARAFNESDRTLSWYLTSTSP